MGVPDVVLAALDLVAFAKACGLRPEPWQEAVLRSSAERVVLLTSRQSGKSTLCAIIALWQAVFRPGSLVIILSPSERQSTELFRKVLGYNRHLGKPVPAESETTTQLHLVNGSRIVALPSTEAKVRGFSAPSLVIVDEASRVADGYFHAVMPMLAAAPDARLILASTPFTPTGFFFDVWEGGDGWERHRVPATEVPHISETRLREAEKTLPSWVFRSEYLCEFTESTGDAAFQVDVVAAAIDEEAELWQLGG